MTDEQMREAVRDQMRHMAASHAVDRRDWTPQRWIDDARRLMGDLDGSVLDLVNGHVLRMLDALAEQGVEIEQLRVRYQQCQLGRAVEYQMLRNVPARLTDERRRTAEEIKRRFQGHPDFNDFARICDEVGGSHG